MIESLEPPAVRSSDKIVKILVTFGSEFPLAGTALEIVHQVFGTSLERRQQAWQDKVCDLLAELGQRVENFDEAVTRPGFVSAVVTASSIARGVHLEEKLDMLKAVLYHAATETPSRHVDLVTLRFLRWIEELEPEHIVVLRYGLIARWSANVVPARGFDFDDDPSEIRAAFAALDLSDDDRVLIGADLEERGLVEIESQQLRVDATNSPHSLPEVEAMRERRREQDTQNHERSVRVNGRYRVTEGGREFLRWLRIAAMP